MQVSDKAEKFKVADAETVAVGINATKAKLSLRKLPDVDAAKNNHETEVAVA